MHSQKIEVNHHASAILPYYTDTEIHFILERKSPDYKPPYFDNALNFIGGNWDKSNKVDKSPNDTLFREIREEFWMQFENPDDLNELLHQEFISERAKDIGFLLNPESLQQRRSVGEMFLNMDRIRPLGDYIIEVSPPITKTLLRCIFSIFARELSSDEFSQLETVLQEYDGKVTTDNLRRGGRTTSVTLDRINQENDKFAWGYDHLLNHALGILSDGNEVIKSRKHGVIRPLTLIKAQPIHFNGEYPATYVDFETSGFKYLEK